MIALTVLIEVRVHYYKLVEDRFRFEVETMNTLSIQTVEGSNSRTTVLVALIAVSVLFAA